MNVIKFYMYQLLVKSNKSKRPEDDLLKVETCSHMKVIIIYNIVVIE
jgi:hypothetical protein